MQKLTFWTFAVASLFFCRAAPVAGSDLLRLHKGTYVPGELLVKFKPAVRAVVSEDYRIRRGVSTLRIFKSIGTQHVRLPEGMTVKEALAIYRDDPNVEYVEPNYYRYATVIPGDTFFAELWGLHNTGQEVDGTFGTPDADIDAPEAWDTQTGDSSVVVAVLDTGVDYNHVDLSANVWVNLDEEIGDGNGDGFPGTQGADDDDDGLTDEDSEGRQPGDVGYTNDLRDDDDENGYVDDILGWNFAYDGDYDGDPDNDNDPSDDNVNKYHGTHVSGIIGAEGDNGGGITGVNWSVSIMALKMLDATGNGSVADEIDAIDYAIANGAKIINASFTGNYFSTPEYEAVERARDAGVLFVAAAGNDGTDNDDDPKYPASYELANIIAVAATDQNDALANFSNYGVTSVDVVAPGENIYSTKSTEAPSPPYYQYLSGTSMATPHVSGLAALIWTEDIAGYDYTDVKPRILNGVDVKEDLIGTVLMAGRINANNSMNPGSVPVAPSMLGVGAVSASEVELRWIDNASNESGFKIERASALAGPYSHILTVASDYESYADTGVSEATTYYYRLCAFNSAGCSGYSNEDSATTHPAAPSGLSASAVSSRRIDLSWADNSSGELGYRIERKTGSGGTYAEIDVVAGDVKAYKSTGLNASTAYYYRIRAYNQGGYSDYSNQTSAKTRHSSGGGSGSGCFIGTVSPGRAAQGVFGVFMLDLVAGVISSSWLVP